MDWIGGAIARMDHFLGYESDLNLFPTISQNQKFPSRGLGVSGARSTEEKRPELPTIFLIKKWDSLLKMLSLDLTQST
jgi:hypothetical protein